MSDEVNEFLDKLYPPDRLIPKGGIWVPSAATTYTIPLDSAPPGAPLLPPLQEQDRIGSTTSKT